MRPERERVFMVESEWPIENPMLLLDEKGHEKESTNTGKYSEIDEDFISSNEILLSNL